MHNNGSKSPTESHRMKNGDASRAKRPKGIQTINVAHKRNPSIASLIKSQRYQQATPTVNNQYTPTLDIEQQLFSPLDDLDDENELRSPHVLQLESGINSCRYIHRYTLFSVHSECRNVNGFLSLTMN